LRVFFGNSNVGETGPFKSSGKGHAIDGSDNRFVDVRPSRRTEQAWRLTPVMERNVFRRWDETFYRSQIGAGAKRLVSGPGYHRDEEFRIVTKGGPGFNEFSMRSVPDAIANLRPVKGDNGRSVTALKFYLSEIH
jgi:hypothetical protein